MGLGITSAPLEGTGYRKTDRAGGVQFGGDTPDGAVLTDATLASSLSAKAMNDPSYNKTSLTSQIGQSVDPSADAGKTLMQRINPGVKYEATMPKGQITFDANKPVTTGVEASRKVGAAERDVEDNMKKFVQDFDKASVQLANAIYDVAGPEKGTQALDALGAFDSARSGKGNAIVTAATQGAFGGAALNLIAIAVAVKDEGKKMSKQEVEQILAEARDKLILDQKSENEAGFEHVSAGPKPESDQKKKFDWEKATLDDLKVLASGDPSNQPEFKLLQQQEKFLIDVRENHHTVQRDYVSSGNLVEKVKAHGLQDQVLAMAIPQIQVQRHEEVKKTETPAYDATAVSLMGSSVQSFSFGSLKPPAAMESVSVVAATLTTQERAHALYEVAPPKAALQHIAQNLFV